MQESLDNLIDEKIRLMIEKCFAEHLAHERATVSGAAEETRRTLELIKAKDVATPGEAALLMSCSPQHLRNQVQKAIDGTADQPIPYCDLGGPIVFPIAELLAWSRLPKQKPLRKTKRNKSHLEVLAS